MTRISIARAFRLGQALTLALVVAVPAFAGAGAVATTSTQEVCSVGSSKLHRSHHSQAARRADFERAGIPWSEHNDYELDQLVPLCLGGADSSENRRPEPFEEAVKKDAVERFACEAVCQGQMTLDKAQSIFLQDEWRAWE